MTCWACYPYFILGMDFSKWETPLWTGIDCCFPTVCSRFCDGREQRCLLRFINSCGDTGAGYSQLVLVGFHYQAWNMESVTGAALIWMLFLAPKWLGGRDQEEVAVYQRERLWTPFKRGWRIAKDSWWFLPPKRLPAGLGHRFDQSKNTIFCVCYQ